MDIKPIETRYKGYRFRSRLEARWAVFFDAFGVAWEYEAEGYDLGELGWYLPDFWLTEHKAFIEIKPKGVKFQAAQGYKVFLAGKIYGRNHGEDWRYELVDGDFYLDDQDDYLKNPFNSCLPMAGGNLFCGPFAIDSFGGHSWGHGVVVNPRVDNPNHNQSYRVGETIPSYVLNNCTERIKQSDIFFAWIDSLDCFGTLTEIGIAKALGKSILIGVDNSNQELMNVVENEMWYALNCAKFVGYGNRVSQVFDKLFNVYLQSYCTEEQLKFKRLITARKTQGFLISGSPWNEEYEMYYYSNSKEGRYKGFLPEFGNGKLQEAYMVARSARFEHGESPKI